MGTKFLRALGAALALTAVACGASNDGDVEDTAGTATVATSIDGVWVFYRSSDDNYDTALLSGNARIENDCLIVGDAVVLWTKAHADEVTQLVSAAKKGESPLVRVGGGARLSDAPEHQMMDRCSFSTLWVAAPPSAFRPQ